MWQWDNGYYKDYNVSEKTIIIGRVGYYCGNIHLTSQKHGLLIMLL